MAKQKKSVFERLRGGAESAAAEGSGAASGRNDPGLTIVYLNAGGIASKRSMLGTRAAAVPGRSVFFSAVEKGSLHAFFHHENPHYKAGQNASLLKARGFLERPPIR